MSYSVQELESLKKNAKEVLLRDFFGVSWVEFCQEGSLKCGFTHRSPDGLSEEKRWCYIKTTNTPEQNMGVLTKALAQRRWYEKCRSADQAYDGRGEVDLARGDGDFILDLDTSANPYKGIVVDDDTVSPPEDGD